jgi:hypothetical protein
MAQPTKVELVVNLKTAKAPGLEMGMTSWLMAAEGRKGRSR